MIKYHLITYGCQMNKSDSERIVSVFKKSGLKPTTKNRADILILNLCSVRQSAIDRAWGLLNTKTRKQIIILTGCILSDDKKKFESKVNLILDIKDLNSWSKKINKLITNYELRIRNYSNQKRERNYFTIKPRYSSQFSAYVPIMSGCNNFCAYCAVPYTRGREQSRPAEDIIQEVYTLIIQGYKQIILLGQNVNSYQSKVSQNKKFLRFPELLKDIDTLPGDYWLSFITSHPKDMSDELINCFKECQHLMPYLHLPVQSGSDKILKKMNRGYTAEHYKNLIKKARAAMPDMAITTDIIVGFPGETKKDFEATANLMKKTKFDMAYIAEYSPRPGTAAAKLKDNVPQPEKTRRRKILNEILKKTALENNKKLIGEVVDVLIENHKNTESTENTLIFYGKTKNFKHVKINVAPAFRQDKIIGQFVKVKITKAGPWGLSGEKRPNCFGRGPRNGRGDVREANRRALWKER